MNTAMSTFPALCKQWRQRRNLSQLHLAETADISQRHLSWLETGRSQPSRDMVLKLADAMEVPLRERNTLLHAAGFAPHYLESGLEEPHMAPVSEALNAVLDHHMPFPAVVVNRRWDRIMANEAADMMLIPARAGKARAVLSISPPRRSLPTVCDAIFPTGKRHSPCLSNDCAARHWPRANTPSSPMWRRSFAVPATYP